MKNKALIIISVLLILSTGLIFFMKPISNQIKNKIISPNPKEMTDPLVEKGYNNNQINLIKKLSNNDQDLIIDLPFINNIEQYLNTPNFCLNKLVRYQNYLSKDNQSIKESIILVNTNIDLPFYSLITTVTNPYSDKVLINKYHKLPMNYKPDLVTVNNKFTTKNWSLVKDASDNFEAMASDALKLNLEIMVSSAYRTYEQQLNLYNSYVKTSGQTAADSFSARPRHSEHETGLAIDVKSNDTSYNRFGYTKEYKWLKDHAHEYGYIIRYPENKTYITGYKSEPWHIRYVGKEVATIIYENNLTLEEYTAIYTELKC